MPFAADSQPARDSGSWPETGKPGRLPFTSTDSGADVSGGGEAASSYLRISEVSAGTVVPKKRAARFPGPQCPLFGLMTLSPMIPEARVLVIGPTVCTYNVKLSLGMRALTSVPLEDNFLLLPMREEDIIFGVEDKLKEAIAEIDDRYRPEVLFVATTCIPEIIGEDFDAVVDGMRDRVRAKLVVIHADQVNGNDLVIGIQLTLAALAEVMTPSVGTDRTVSLLGYYYPEGPQTELAGLLQSRGVTIKRTIPAVASLSHLVSAPDAALNLVIDPRALSFARQMKARFGTPFLFAPRAYSLDGVCRWYRNIAVALDIDITEEIASLFDRATEKIEALKPRLEGKSVALRAVAARSFAVARFLVDLGMRPKLIHVGEILEKDEADIRYLLEKGFDPILVNGEDSVEMDDLLAQLRPDVMIAINRRDVQPASQMGIRVVSLEAASQGIGFECSVAVARILAEADEELGAVFFKNRFIRTDR